METFADILDTWRKAARESDKRALWRTLARGGWLQACRTAVQQHDRTTLTDWLDETHTIQQEIIQFSGPHAAQTVYTHLACSLAACERNADTDGEILPVPPLTKEGTEMPPFAKGAARSAGGFERVTVEGQTFTTSINASPLLLTPPGFCRDLRLALLGQPLRQAERDLSMTVLLVDTARNEGVVATLTLEMLPDGSGELYPVPAFAFLRDDDFRQAEDNARAYLEQTSFADKHKDVRWRLQRRDHKPLTSLSGPSLGAAFALGIGKLCVG